MICGSTTAFQRRKFPLVSFSCGGGPRDEVVVVDEEAKVEEEVVESAPMVLGIMVAEVVDILSMEEGS